jgi:hypothetical protein
MDMDGDAASRKQDAPGDPAKAPGSVSGAAKAATADGGGGGRSETVNATVLPKEEKKKEKEEKSTGGKKKKGVKEVNPDAYLDPVAIRKVKPMALAVSCIVVDKLCDRSGKQRIPRGIEGLNALDKTGLPDLMAQTALAWYPGLEHMGGKIFLSLQLAHAIKTLIDSLPPVESETQQ